MKCEWCAKDAVYGGERPEGATGRKYFAACTDHHYLIDRLEYEPRDVGEIRLALRREERDAKLKVN